MGRKPWNPLYAFLKNCIINPTSCWEWKGKINKNTGYANFNASGIFYNGHKFSYEYFVKPVNADNIIHHICEKKTCCNPDHLREISCKDHTHIHNTPCGINSRKEECIHGHKFTQINTYVTPTGRRQCRVCMKNRHIKWLNSHNLLPL